jgi:4-carboxymuconolactone decarboxylase
MSDYREAGKEIFEKMMGPNAARQMAAAAEETSGLAALAGLGLDFAFGAVWSRPGLELKQRSLIVIAILITTRMWPELKNHIRIGIRNGLTRTEIEEALIQCLPYVGFPAVASASGLIIEVLRELGLDTDTKTAEEKGLL